MQPRQVAVAYSGGRDSTALLHATARAAPAADVALVALHVHHGLHDDADDWLDFCASTCSRWRIGFASARLEARPPAGQSVEAWAREQRYRAIASMAHEHGASLVLLGQHRRDQAETFLLQALRGAGVAGLAAMPARFERDGIVWARPWLRHRREAIEAYVRRHRLRFIDDGSNADPRFARNRLRLQVWPALTGAFEQAEAALADAATRAAQADELIDEIAAADLTLVDRDGALAVVAWRDLSAARRRHALLAWLRRDGIASAAIAERLMRELPDAGSGARWPVTEDTELRLYRGRLMVDKNAAPRRAMPTGAQPEALLCVGGPGRYALPAWGGELAVRRVKRGGVAAALLASLRVTARCGGETFQSAARSTPRSLKKQFQALGVPAWQRGGPLLYSGEQLVFVPGLGIDARARAGADEPQFSVRWTRDAPR